MKKIKQKIRNKILKKIKEDIDLLFMEISLGGINRGGKFRLKKYYEVEKLKKYIDNKRMILNCEKYFS